MVVNSAPHSGQRRTLGFRALAKARAMSDNVSIPPPVYGLGESDVKRKIVDNFGPTP